MGEVKEIKSIPVVPFALMIAAIAAVITFIIGILATIFAVPFLAMVPTEATGGVALGGAMMAVVFIIVWPIMAFIGGFIMYAIIALIYNLLASRIGGIKLELE